MRKAKIVTNYP